MCIHVWICTCDMCIRKNMGLYKYIYICVYESYMNMWLCVIMYLWIYKNISPTWISLKLPSGIPLLSNPSRLLRQGRWCNTQLEANGGRGLASPKSCHPVETEGILSHYHLFICCDWLKMLWLKTSTYSYLMRNPFSVSWKDDTRIRYLRPESITEAYLLCRYRYIYVCLHMQKTSVNTLPETSMTPENRPSQKETSIPTIHFQGLC